MRCVLCFLLFLCSCSPNSSTEFRKEGEARCRSLIQDLGKIENREQLLSMELNLKKHFESLVNLMIQAREFQQKHLDDLETENTFEEESADIRLEEELRRIYGIEGGREIIERCQHEALFRLDAYERALTKKREQLIPHSKT